MTPDTILVRARNIELRIEGADDVCILHGEERFERTPHALAVLDAFAQPRTLADVLDSVAKNQEEWIEVSSTIYQLARAGVLVDPKLPDAAPRGFASPPIHVAMLDDRARTSGFIAALKAVVTDTDVVVDIGTGTGVLATVAALAGAARVYAIEASIIGEAAQRVFAANGVADRVSLVRGRSTQLTLAERGDVLVTEIIGNDPLDESMLEIVDDAKRRLLAPNARIIPSAFEIFAVALELPASVYERHAFTPERIAAWREAYGVDFSTLMSVRRTASQPTMVKTDDVLSWTRVAPPVSLAAIDLTGPFDVVLQRRASFVLERDVARLAVVLAFRATLAPGIVLSTLPGEVDPANHWRYAMFPAHDRTGLAAGTTVTLDYGYDRGTTTLDIT